MVAVRRRVVAIGIVAVAMAFCSRGYSYLISKKKIPQCYAMLISFTLDKLTKNQSPPLIVRH